MTAIARTDVTATAAAPAESSAPAKKANPKAVAVATTDAEPAKAAPTDFAKQLQKATKPVVKKPTIALGDDAAAAAQSLAQPTPDTSALAQIIAAIMNGATAVTTTATPTPDTATPEDPKLALTASLDKATSATTDAPETTQNALLEQMVAVKPEAAPQLAPAEPPLTPLEQAVHDMLSEVAERKQAPADPTTAMQGISLAPPQTINATEVALEVQHAAPVAQTPPQELVSQNHAHLVIDDPSGRVVLTVAVRGNDVNVTMRASNDSTAAALARNAGSLDEAMRGRGLALAQFDSQRDLAREQNSDKPTYQQREKQPKTPAFTLEENS